MIFTETQKYYHVLDSKFIFQVLIGHIHDVVLTLLNVVKINVENENVVSKLPDVVQINIETTLKSLLDNYYL